MTRLRGHLRDSCAHRSSADDADLHQFLLHVCLQSSDISGMKTYYDPKDLKRFGDIAEWDEALAKKFFEWYGAVFEDGALTGREKALIALGVAHAIQCPYCIDAYTQDLLQRGESEEGMMEAVHVAGAIRGGASLVHGVQMMQKAKSLSM